MQATCRISSESDISHYVVHRLSVSAVFSWVPLSPLVKHLQEWPFRVSVLPLVSSQDLQGTYVLLPLSQRLIYLQACGSCSSQVPWLFTCSSYSFCYSLLPLLDVRRNVVQLRHQSRLEMGALVRPNLQWYHWDRPLVYIFPPQPYTSGGIFAPCHSQENRLYRWCSFHHRTDAIVSWAYYHVSAWVNTS